MTAERSAAERARTVSQSFIGAIAAGGRSPYRSSGCSNTTNVFVVRSPVLGDHLRKVGHDLFLGGGRKPG
jgi:hypothetical protein